jgi:hypothetical protein
MENLSTAYLKQKRKQLTKQLMKIETFIIRGSLIVRYKKCGKINCKCAIENGHGPKYYLSVTIPKSNPIIIYVPDTLKPTVETGLLNYQRAKKIMEELSHVNRELLIRRHL